MMVRTTKQIRLDHSQCPNFECYLEHEAKEWVLLSDLRLCIADIIKKNKESLGCDSNFDCVYEVCIEEIVKELEIFK